MRSRRWVLGALIVALALSSCSGSQATDRDPSCTPVVRPASGDLAVPAAGGGDRLAKPIRWDQVVTLEPAPPDLEPTMARGSIDLEASTPPPVVKLAVSHDPAHRSRNGDGRLVWAVFYPQVPSAGSGGPPVLGDEATTITAGPAPCAMTLATYDAATGAPYLYLSVG